MASSEFEDLLIRRDERARRRHRREVFWQISVPLTLGGLAVIAAGILAGWSTARGSDLSAWSGRSLVFLICPVLIVGLIPLALLGGAVVGVARLTAGLPFFFYKIQNAFDSIRRRSLQLGRGLAAPIIRLRSVPAGWKAVRTSLRQDRKP